MMAKRKTKPKEECFVVVNLRENKAALGKIMTGIVHKFELYYVLGNVCNINNLYI